VRQGEHSGVCRHAMAVRARGQPRMRVHLKPAQSERVLSVEIRHRLGTAVPERNTEGRRRPSLQVLVGGA